MTFERETMKYRARQFTSVGRFVLLAAGFGFLSFAGQMTAAPGELDQGFGVQGRKVTQFPPVPNAWIWAVNRAMTLQPDGKVVLAGSYDVERVGNGAFALVRYNADGTADTSFGNNGVVLSDFSSGDDEAYDVAVQPDGKIVAAGQAYIANGNNAFALARYNPDGSPDASFGNAGRVITDFFASLDEVNAVLIQPDGKIIAAGFVTNGANNGATYEFAVARYNPNGSLDSSFGNNGTVLTDFFGSGDIGYDAVLQPDGKIVVAGRVQNPVTGIDFGLVRYNPDGSLDSTFDGDGKLNTALSADHDEFARGLALAPDGKLVAAGWTTNGRGASAGQSDYAIVRYNPDGSLDSTFSGDGKLLHDFAGAGDSQQASAVVVQANGKIVVGGGSHAIFVTGGQHRDYGLLRLNPDGTRDGSFGDNGEVHTDFGIFQDPFRLPITGEPWLEMALALQPDGRILAAAAISFGTGRKEFGVARYMGDLSVLGGASRKTHGNAGTFDLPLPLEGPVGVEGRESNGSHALVVNFNRAITSGSASITGGQGTIVGDSTFSDGGVNVNLTNVHDGQTITLTLNNMRDDLDRTLPSMTLSVQFRAGDVSGNGNVNASDISQIKSQIGAAVNAANFRNDVTANGVINSSDVSLAKARAGGVAIPNEKTR